jgi:penicillin-insensitive murein DD-endopeptidase
MRAWLYALGSSFAIVLSPAMALGLQGSSGAERDQGEHSSRLIAKGGTNRQPRTLSRTSRAEPALSIGSPTRGRLTGADELENQDAIRVRRPARARWGLPDLVGMLTRGAQRVRKRYPGSVLLVGDLSREQGGPIPGHRSHESGRDADVGFYYVDRKGRVASPERFLTVLVNGRAKEQPELAFDERRNWALVQAWLTDPKARVQHIFVSKPLRSRLLSYARAHGVYVPVLHRAAIALKQPSRGLSHDDHFHVRIGCPFAQSDVCQAEPERPRRKKRTREKKPQRIAKILPGAAPALALVKTR